MMRLSVIVAVLVVLASPTPAWADDVTTANPWLKAADDDIKELVSIYAACATANNIGGLSFSAEKLSGATIYEIDTENPAAPNVDAYGGTVGKTGGGIVKFMAIKKSSFPKEPNSKDCIELGALLLHELHHVWAWEWIIAQCNAQPDPNACIQCVKALDQCMKDNDPTGNGENQLEESRAHFATALCLCKQACALPPGDARDKLESQAGALMLKANTAWDNGVTAWNACSSSNGGNHGDCGLPTSGGPPGYPMPPLNPGGTPPTAYGDPWPSHPTGQPNGGTFTPPPPAPPMSFSCDCDYKHDPDNLDYDPCDTENE